MKRFLPLVNIFATIIALTVNVLASALPLNGKNTGAISDQFMVLFVPASYVFAIWSVIYIGWIAFSLYQALPSQRDNPRLQRIGWLYALSGVLNAGWLFAWHYELFPLSVVVMLALLVTLIGIYLRLDNGRVQVSATEKWCVNIPFSVYLGWISVATIANITDLLYYWRWDGWGIAPELWAVIMLVVATALGLAMTLMRRDVAFLLVLVWSFTGIAVKQAATPLVANTAWVMVVLVALMIPLGVVYRRKIVAPAFS
ncbi:MAG: tryptophan-rich sensory protein [Chloroflexi bacterium]|nr:tryptophan-rich sensory protein [Chloroflexota bacterium]